MSAAEAEQSSLRERLEDAEAVCRALQHGEVDAFVVGRTDDERRVLLLSPAYAGYRRLVEEMPQGAVTVSGTGEVLHANRAFADLLGVAPALRTTLEASVVPADHGKLREALRAGGEGTVVDVSILRRDGSEVLVRLSVVHSADEFATLVLTRADAASTDEARDTVDAIRQGGVDAFVVGGDKIVMLDSAQAPYRALVERMRQGAVTVHDGTIVYANERFAAMAGAVVGGWVGGSIVDVIDPLDQSAFRTFLEQTSASQIEVRIRAQDRSRRTVLVGLTPLGGHKLLLFSDISERKRHAASEELNRRFLGLLADEFTALLGPIGASVEALRETVSKPEAHRALDVIQRQARRLGELVADLRRINPKD